MPSLRKRRRNRVQPKPAETPEDGWTRQARAIGA